MLNISQPGQEGGHAVADILFGKAVPEGKLTATWAMRYADYPFSDTYSYLNGDLEKEVYREGIYVGYRYFDSFGVKPLWSFGYGLVFRIRSFLYFVQTGILRPEAGAVFSTGGNIRHEYGKTLCGAGSGAGLYISAAQRN